MNGSFVNGTSSESSTVVYCIKGVAACSIMLLSVVKLICIKKLYHNRLSPHTVFIISFSLADLCLGFMTFLVTWTDYFTKKHVDTDSIIYNVHAFAKCGLFACFTISFIHLNVFELVRMKVVSKPFLRQRLTNHMVMKFILGSWIAALCIAFSSHFFLKMTSSVEQYENLFLSVLAMLTFPTLYFCVRKIHKVIGKRRASQVELLGRSFDYSTRKSNQDVRIRFPKMKKMSALVPLIAFCVCWTPFIICTVARLSDIFDQCLSARTNQIIHSIVCLAPYLNYMLISAMYIYTIVKMKPEQIHGEISG